MRQHRKTESGFTIVEILIVVLVIAVLISAGWLVYSNAHKNKVTTTPPGNSQSNTPTQQPTSQLLVIKEWRVSIPLSDTIKDAYYTFVGSNTDADGTPNTAWLGLTSLNSSGCNVASTGPTTSAKPMGSIIRALPTDTDPVKGKRYTELYPNGTTINGYYYAYAPWQNKTCASASTLQSIDSAFGAGAKAATASSTTN